MRKRNYTIDKVLKQIEKRKSDFLSFIQTQKNYADVIIKYYSEDLQDDNFLQDISKNINVKMHILISDELFNKLIPNELVFYCFNFEKIDKNNTLVPKYNEIEKIRKVFNEYLNNKKCTFIKLNEDILNNLFIQIIFFIIIYN